MLIPTNFLPKSQGWEAPDREAILTALERAHWTQTEFAKRVGVTDKTVGRWVSGAKKINYAAWCVLCVEARLGLIW